ATSTVLFGIDTIRDVLVIINPPNSGTLTTVGSLGVNTSAVSSFDIVPGSNTAFADLTVNGVAGLYSINLATGVAELVGNFTGGVALLGLAAVPDNDLIVWNNGDNTDLVDGGFGQDVMQVNGAAAGDTFVVAANGTRVKFDRTNLVPFTLDIGTVEELDV